MKNSLLKTLVLLLLIFYSATLFAQDDILKEKSIFWEITPKDGGKPSYLYGTMHVSKKVAFRLPEKFYDAIEASDIVALESDPSKWSEGLESSKELQELFEMYNLSRSSNFGISGNYYEKSYGLRPIEKEDLQNQLSYEPVSVNNLLFRSFNWKKDFEKDTYLDLYIYKTGKRLNKKIGSLEDIVWSTKSVIKSSMAQPSKKRRKKYVSPISINQELEDAYRDRDLLKIDSLVQISSPSDEHLDALLYVRNDTMFHTIDQTIKRGKSIFAAAGAAHLVGKKGLIMMLKNAGYKLTPVKEAFNVLQSEKVNKLDSSFVPVSFTKKYSKDSSLSFYTPAYNSRSVFNGKVEYLSTDMANGIYYYIGRLNTYQFLGDETSEKFEERIDSLLFENIAGKIVSKEKNLYQNYPCIDIKSVTREGKMHRLKIIITPLEILFCKVMGKEHYFTDYSVDSFFNKINIQYANSNILDFWDDVEVTMPIDLKDYPYSRINFTGPNAIIQGLDNEGDYYQVLRSYNVRTYEHEVDTFHLNMYQYFIAKTFDLDVLESTPGFVNGLPCLDVAYKTKKNKNIITKIIARGSNIYFLTIATNSTDKADAFFNSFKLKSIDQNNLPIYEDTSAAYSLRTNLKPMGGDLGREVNKQRLNTDQTGTRYKQSFSTVLKDSRLGYQININKYTINKYINYPTIDSFWNAFVEENFSATNGKLITSKKTWTDGNQHKMRLSLSDTGSVNMSKYLYVTSGNELFEVYTFQDTCSPNFAYIDKGLESFNMLNAKQSILTTSKLDTFIHNLQSSDSTIKDFFNKNYNFLSLTTDDEISFLNLIDTSKVLEKKDNTYENMLYSLTNFKTKRTRDFIKRLYHKNEDNSSRQVTLLNVLAYMKDTPSTMLFKELITTSAPLGFDDDDNPLSLYNDTLTLARVLFPDLLQLIDYDDYKLSVIYLLEKLYLDKKIEPSVYEHKVKYFTFKGLEELKRKTSQKSSLQEEIEKDEDDEDEDEYNNYSSYMDFTIRDEKDNWSSKINFYEFGTIETYAVLLEPFKSRPSVQRFFTKIDSTKNKDLQFFFALKHMRDTLEFDEEVVKNYSDLPSYKYKIIHDFYFHDQMQYLPFKVKNQEQTARFKLQELTEIKDPEKIELVAKEWISSKEDEGYLYIFKYEVKEETRYGYMGLFAKNRRKLVPKRSIYTYNIDIKKQREEEFISNLKTQFRALDRTFISPSEMVKKKSSSFNFPSFLRN